MIFIVFAQTCLCAGYRIPSPQKENAPMTIHKMENFSAHMTDVKNYRHHLRNLAEQWELLRS